MKTKKIEAPAIRSVKTGAILLILSPLPLLLLTLILPTQHWQVCGSGFTCSWQESSLYVPLRSTFIPLVYA
ncbi:MAG: hypothetical protein WAQ25_03585, partial [Candidatus Saccharimonas sp.]